MLDDRGKEVKILDQTAFEPWPLKGDDRIAKLIVRLAVALRGENLLFRFLMAVGMVLVFYIVIGVTFTAAHYLWSGRPGWLVFLVMFAVAAALGRLQFRFLRGWKSARLARAVIGEGLCPCCGYNLHGIPTTEDAIVACPECGSAWRASRIKRTADFAPGSTFGNPLRTIHKKSNRQNWTTRDAGGQRVGLIDPRLRALVRTAAPQRAAELRPARREIARLSRWMRWPVIAVMLALAAGSIFMIWHEKDDDGWWFLWLLFLLILGGATLGATFSNFLYSARATRDVLVRIRFCPSCAADMTAIQPSADGNLGCPGCLAEWKEAPNHG